MKKGLVANSLLQLSETEKKVIKKQFFPPDASDADMIYCMSVAENLGLNPVLKEIHFITRRVKHNGEWITKVEPLIGKNGAYKIAHMSGQFDGIESGTEIRDVPVFKNGAWTTIPMLVGWAIAYRKDFSHPVSVDVAYNEYVQLKSDGTPNIFWLKMPNTMIKKVAEVQVLMKAFNIVGVGTLYDPDVSIGEADQRSNKPSQSAKDKLKAIAEELDEDVEAVEVDDASIENEDAKDQDAVDDRTPPLPEMEI